MLAGEPTLRACRRALGLGAEASPALVIAAIGDQAPDQAAALAALQLRGEACDFAVETSAGAFAVAGRSAGALAWLCLTLTPSRPLAQARARSASENLLEIGLLDTVADAVALFDAKRRLTWHNAAFSELWGLEPAWLAERPSHGEWLDRLRRRRRLPETRDYAAFKARELARHESVAPAAPALWRLPDERTLKVTSGPRAGGGLALVFSDITREVGLTGRLNQLVQVQRATLDKLTDAVAVFGGDGRLSLHNEAFERFWGITGAQIAERPDFDGVVDLCVPRLHDLAFWRDLKGRVTDADPGLRAGAVAELTIGDGRRVVHQSRPLPDGATLIGFADVSDRRRLEAALAGREAALGEAERLRKAFVASVSYELRTPLTTVLGYCELIEQGGRIADDRDRAYLAAVRGAASQLAGSINDVLTMAEIDAGELVLDVEEADVADLLAAAAGRRAADASASSVEIRVSPDGGGGPMRGDPRRLGQVLDHLVDYALRHTGDGGAIVLSASRADREVRLSVADNGRGLPFDIQAHVFDRIGQDGAAGLGLPLVKAIVELHGGWVALESEPGAGTTITCHLPEEAQAGDGRPELFPSTAGA